MNKFEVSSQFFLERNGHNITYIRVVEGEYDVETGSTVNTETSVNIKAYPKIVKVSQFNYPNLIGKEVIDFLIGSDSLSSVPESADKIIYNNQTYSVVSHMEHSALGKVILYRVTATKL